MKIDFKNQVVLITGATRGIGKQLAENFAESGARLILTGTQKDQIDRLNFTAGQKRLNRKYYCVDFTHEENLERFLNDLKPYKCIDVCINNAGINRLNYIDKTKIEDWGDMINVNLRAPYLLIRHVSKLMKKNRYGRIINIASIFGIISREKRSMYTATKYGLHGITVTTALELAKYNVLVNTISPGFIRTDMTAKNLSAKEQKQLVRQIPAGRFGVPEDISRVVMFFASAYNTYVTGQNIVADGGYISA
jgi:3-oxoacyl-[acyl-carrier protein] reductase